MFILKSIRSVFQFFQSAYRNRLDKRKKNSSSTISDSSTNSTDKKELTDDELWHLFKNSNFKSNGVVVEKSDNPIFSHHIRVTHPGNSSNEQLILRFNELRYVTLPPRLLIMYLNDLHQEFYKRFGKSPFGLNSNGKVIQYGGKLEYLSQISNYVVLDKN